MCVSISLLIGVLLRFAAASKRKKEWRPVDAGHPAAGRMEGWGRRAREADSDVSVLGVQADAKISAEVPRGHGWGLVALRLVALVGRQQYVSS